MVVNLPLATFCLLGAIAGVAPGLWVLDSNLGDETTSASGHGRRRWTTYAVVACGCSAVGTFSIVLGVLLNRYLKTPGSWIGFVPPGGGLVVAGIIVGRFVRMRNGRRVGSILGLGFAAMLTVLALLGGAAANITWHVVAGDLFVSDD